MGRRKRKNSFKNIVIEILALIIFLILGYFNYDDQNTDTLQNENKISQSTISYELKDIPEYENVPYVVINNNIPNFNKEDYSTKSFEIYSELDILGRCGIAYANINKKIMPKESEERESISEVRPTGWRQAKYDGEYVYNRCHLIGWQLAGENANELNLITGTRYMNVEGMLPFENQIAEYIKNNKNAHVLYRVTPVFEGDNLLASGVQMEAYSVEDNGKSVSFNVYVYNVQPGVTINYQTGEIQK